MFFLNELEATQFTLLIKEVGWVPSKLIKSSLTNFSPPQCIFQQIDPKNALLGEAVLVHLMLLFYTAKMLLNKQNIVIIIQQYIEINTYSGFGALFNNWIRLNQGLITLDLQRLNRAFNKLNSKDVSYKIPDPPKYGYTATQLTQNYAPMEIMSMMHVESSARSMPRTRKSSFNSINGDLFDLMPDYPNALSRNPSFEFRNMMPMNFSRQSSIN